MKLCELAALPCRERADEIVAAWWSSLSQAVVTSHELTGTRLSITEVAWAVAYNIAGTHEAVAIAEDRQEVPRNKRRSYIDEYGPAFCLDALHAILTRPIPGKGAMAATSRLAELAASVSCEQCIEWQHPDHGVPASRGQLALEALVGRYLDYVASFVGKRFGSRAGEPADVASVAWSEMFLTYWSPKPRRRFLAKSRIVTTVCSIALFKTVDELAGQAGGEAGHDDPPRLDPPAPIATVALASPAEREEFTAAYDACLSALTPRQRQAVILKHDRGLKNKDIAVALGVSRPRVTQLIDEAEARLAQCLQMKGIEP